MCSGVCVFTLRKEGRGFIHTYSTVSTQKGGREMGENESDRDYMLKNKENE